MENGEEAYKDVFKNDVSNKCGDSEKRCDIFSREKFPSLSFVIGTQTKSFLAGSALIHIRNILTYGKR